MFTIEWVRGAKVLQREPNRRGDLAGALADARALTERLPGGDAAARPDRFRILDDNLDQVAIERI